MGYLTLAVPTSLSQEQRAGLHVSPPHQGARTTSLCTVDSGGSATDIALPEPEDVALLQALGKVVQHNKAWAECSVSASDPGCLVVKLWLPARYWMGAPWQRSPATAAVFRSLQPLGATPVLRHHKEEAAAYRWSCTKNTLCVGWVAKAETLQQFSQQICGICAHYRCSTTFP